MPADKETMKEINKSVRKIFWNWCTDDLNLAQLMINLKKARRIAEEEGVVQMLKEKRQEKQEEDEE